MQCDIYRPKSRTNLYVFVQSGINPRLLPTNNLAQFSELELIKTREIVAGQSLVGASTDEILRNIASSGFHIQGVKLATQVSDGGAALGGGILGASVAGPFGAIVGALIGLAVAEHAKKVPDGL